MLNQIPNLLGVCFGVSIIVVKNVPQNGSESASSGFGENSDHKLRNFVAAEFKRLYDYIDLNLLSGQVKLTIGIASCLVSILRSLNIRGKHSTSFPAIHPINFTLDKVYGNHVGL